MRKAREWLSGQSTRQIINRPKHRPAGLLSFIPAIIILCTLAAKRNLLLATKTKLNIIESGMEKLPFPDNYFDRVICISVIEHVDRDIAKKGIQEMSRVLKINGRLIVTLDVNLLSELGRPLDLLWDSHLLSYGSLDLRWPYQRFGNFCDGLQPADVFGLIMQKNPYILQTKYSLQMQKGKFERKAWKISNLRKKFTEQIERKKRVEQLLPETFSETQDLKQEKSGILGLFKRRFSK